MASLKAEDRQAPGIRQQWVIAEKILFQILDAVRVGIVTRAGQQGSGPENRRLPGSEGEMGKRDTDDLPADVLHLREREVELAIEIRADDRLHQQVRAGGRRPMGNRRAR